MQNPGTGKIEGVLQYKQPRYKLAAQKRTQERKRERQLKREFKKYGRELLLTPEIYLMKRLKRKL